MKNNKNKVNVKYTNNYKKYFIDILKEDKIGGKKHRSKNIKKNKNNIINENLSENKNLASKIDSKKKLTIFDKDVYNNIKYQIDKDSNISDKKSKMSDRESKISDKEKKDLTDYELNELEYVVALELDNRNFLNIYWYLLKREHIILFTFFNWNDFNLFSIKLSKLFLSICSDMAFNVFFFSDESMHDIYSSGGEHN